MTKKGSLSLSITAIVVIVIAFVVLGLGLSLTRTIFKGAEDQLPAAFDLTSLEAVPSAENPITIAKTIEIARNKKKTLGVGFYNKDSSNIDNARFVITSCLDPVGEIPTVKSIEQKVGPNSAAAFSLILEEKGLRPDTYICNLAVCKDADCTDDPYQTKQIFLTVTS